MRLYVHGDLLRTVLDGLGRGGGGGMGGVIPSQRFCIKMGSGLSRVNKSLI